MPHIDKSLVTAYVEQNIGDFHRRRIESLSNLEMRDVLAAKNPYMFRAKNMLTAAEIVKAITDAYLSSREETIFGSWLEGLAIYLNGAVYGGRKSGIEGIDLEFDRDGVRYIVAIKSGPNWGNSSQQQRMKDNFVKAARILRTSNSGIMVQPINGCSYGREVNTDKGTHFKFCGQKFWEFVSGDVELYKNIIEPLGHEALNQNEAFAEQYAKKINLFTISFSEEFCLPDGSIDWEKIVVFNSGGEVRPRRIRRRSAGVA